jgi:hypothetical protein
MDGANVRGSVPFADMITRWCLSSRFRTTATRSPSGETAGGSARRQRPLRLHGVRLGVAVLGRRGLPIRNRHSPKARGGVRLRGHHDIAQSFSSIGVAGNDLGFDGFAGTSVDAAAPSITTSFDGVIDYSLAGGHIRCASANHRLILTRR